MKEKCINTNNACTLYFKRLDSIGGQETITRAFILVLTGFSDIVWSSSFYYTVWFFIVY